MSCFKSHTRKNNVFHFQATWLSHPQYDPIVGDTWVNTSGN